MLSMCKVISIRSTWNYLATNGSLSEVVPLTAIAEAIHVIDVLRKHRRTNQTAVQSREWKQSFLRTSRVRGYFPATLEQKAEIAISLSL